ncbi:diguanylate cyclase [Pseudonocardia sp. CA-107938]|uniref:sensor domain-containing diguanylate cyclase n=1 Tax=Pseudonocardia sp. CA-107938 TaxID=3240021 RepID=UPI003D8EE3F1
MRDGSSDGRWPVGTLLVAMVATAASVVFCRVVVNAQALPAISLPNAVVLAALLIVPRRVLLRTAVVLAVTCVTTGVAMGAAVVPTAGSTMINTGVVLLAALVLRRDPAWIEGTTERASSWLRFTLVGALVPFTLGALAQCLWRYLLRGGPAEWEQLATTALTYAATNVVAALLIVPAVLRLRPTYLRRRPAAEREAELAWTVAVLVVLTTVLMVLDQPLLLILLPIPLVVATVRHGALGANLAALAVVPIVIGSTASGHGPFVAVADGSQPVGLLWAQLFLVLLMATGFAVLATLDGHGPGHAYRRAVEEAGDLVALVHADGSGPDADGWWSRIHPADRPALLEAVAAAERDGSAERLTRVRHADGSWRWFDLRLRPAAADDEAAVLVIGRDVTVARLRELHLEERNQELLAAAGTDPLTGLANRRRLAEAQAASWAAAAAAQEPLSLLVVDVDHFKSFNDRHGHVRGDAVLAAVAAAIEAALRRPTDLAARYGGEEFVVLLPHTDAAGAALVAEAVRQSVRGSGIAHETSATGAVTVSIGVATARPRPGDVDDGSLLQAADAALYRAKQRGRDRVEVA